jgi:hypothetical protein
VVEVAMRQHNGDRMQAVLSDDLVELTGYADARIDHDALLAVTWCHDETVRSCQLRGKALDEHDATLRFLS